MDQGARHDPQRDPQRGTVTKSSSDDCGERRRGPVSPNWSYDDYPLTPVESRLVQRIERRGIGRCYDSVTSLAEDFFTSQQSIRSATATLEGIGAITIEYAKGPYGTNIYKLNPLENWLYFSDLKARLAAISSVSNFTEKRQLRTQARVEIRDQIEAAAAKVKAKRKAEQDEKKKQRTPVKIDRGQELENNPGLSKSTAGALQNQQATPAESSRASLSKTTDEGFPSEGFPSEGNPEKVIPHTQRRAAPAEGGRFGADDSDSLRSSGASLRSDAVCVSPSNDLFFSSKEEPGFLGAAIAVLEAEGIFSDRDESEITPEEYATHFCPPYKSGLTPHDEGLDQDQGGETENPWDCDPWSRAEVTEYAYYLRDTLGEDIRNPIGLAKSILKEQDPDTWHEIEAAMISIDAAQQSRAVELRRHGQERVPEEGERERQNEENHREEKAVHSQPAEEETRRDEEWERNAPHREAARLEQQRRATAARFENAKRLAKHSTSRPDLYAGMIKNALEGDEVATRLFEEWLTDEGKTRSAGAA